MGSKTSTAERRAVPLAEFAAEVDRRRADYEARYGVPCVLPHNRGKRRTASKRALLKAIEEAGGKW